MRSSLVKRVSTEPDETPVSPLSVSRSEGVAEEIGGASGVERAVEVGRDVAVVADADGAFSAGPSDVPTEQPTRLGTAAKATAVITILNRLLMFLI